MQNRDIGQIMYTLSKIDARAESHTDFPRGKEISNCGDQVSTKQWEINYEKREMDIIHVVESFQLLFLFFIVVLC